MHCFALPGRSCENLNFPTICPKIAEKSLATSQKTVGLFNYTGFLVLMAKLFGRENKNSNFHNISLEVQNNPYAFLDQRHLYQTAPHETDGTN